MNAILLLNIKCVHFDFVDWCSSVTNPNKTKRCSASQLQNECKNIGGTVPKFKDKLGLKHKMNCSDLKENKTYWTALRYEQVFHKRKTKVNMLLVINSSFIITNGTNRHNYDSPFLKFFSTCGLKWFWATRRQKHNSSEMLSAKTYCKSEANSYTELEH